MESVNESKLNHESCLCLDEKETQEAVSAYQKVLISINMSSFAFPEVMYYSVTVYKIQSGCCKAHSFGY